jgi:long-chain acyl-CoA synthetase
VKNSLHRFPGYAKINDIGIIGQPWGIGNGFMTPTMKLRRSRILEKNTNLVDKLYEGH